MDWTLCATDIVSRRVTVVARRSWPRAAAQTQLLNLGNSQLISSDLLGERSFAATINAAYESAFATAVSSFRDPLQAVRCSWRTHTAVFMFRRAVTYVGMM